MKSPQRVTRPTLERTAPNRGWGTLFGASSTTPLANGTTSKPPERAMGMDAVQRGVELAYRVSEEYLKQGQSFARTVSQPFASMTQPGGASAPPGGSSNPLPQLTERMLRYTSELSAMWMEAMRMMSNGANGAAGPGLPFAPWARAEAPAPAAPAARARPEGRVGVQIESKLRARATLDLEDTRGQPIALGPLQLEGGAAIIRGVEVEREDGGTTIVIAIPAKQAPGTYVAAVRDAATKAPLGTVRVRVSR